MIFIRKILFQIVVITLFIFTNNVIIAQNKSELRADKLRTEKEIKYANKLLEQTKRKKKNQYNELLVINNKISVQEKYVKTLNLEISYLNVDIKRMQDSINSLRNDLENLKRDYSVILRQVYKHRNNYEMLLYLFSSKDFDQAYKRIKYMKQYDKYRRKKELEIISKKNSLTAELNKINLTKAEISANIIDIKNTEKQLGSDKEEQYRLINKLKKKEKQLKIKITKKTTIAKKLNKAIEKIIAEEIRKAEELALKSKNKSVSILTPEEKLISDKFEENKTRLPWPTERGIITAKFGIHNHAVLKGVKIRNDGIDITTTEGSYARAVFNGVVTKIVFIKGINKVIIIKHGNYYTVYTNIDEVLVSVNQKVKKKQLIGKIHTDTENNLKTSLNFQIWKGSNKLDPSLWISR